MQERNVTIPWNKKSIKLCFKACIFWSYEKETLTLSYIILKNGQTNFKNLAVSTPQDLESMFDHISTSSWRGWALFK